MKKIRPITFAMLLYSMLISCRGNQQTNSNNVNTNDSLLEQSTNNSGMPLDDINRTADADTLKQEPNENTGVPLNNLRRDQTKDSISQTNPQD